MKKILLTVLSVFLFLSGISYVEAAVTFTPVEKNGKASLNLHFDTGYVGGMELKAKVTGDVKVAGVDFNSSFKNYTKRYNYDPSSKILTIYVAAGDNQKNLLDKNNDITIGTLNVTSTKENEKYSLKLQSLTIVEASYTSKKESDITTSENSFVVKKQESSNRNTNSNSNKNSNTNTNTNSNSNKNSNNNTNSNNNSNNQVDNSNSNSNSNSSSNEESNTNSNTNSLSNSNTNSTTNSSTNSSSNKKEDKKEEKSGFPFIYLLFGIGVLAIVGIIAFIIKKKRD